MTSNLPPLLDRLVRWRNFIVSARRAQNKIDVQKRTEAQQELDRIVIAEGIEKWVHEEAKSSKKVSSK